MSTDEPPPDAEQVVDDLEEDVVDLDRLKTEDGSRAVPGTPEPPD
jgi:hypothetical protein